VSVQITVQVRPEVAAGLRGPAGAPEAPEVPAPAEEPEATASAGTPEVPAPAEAPEATASAGTPRPVPAPAVASEVRALMDATGSLGAALRPVHPSGGDPELGAWFTLEVPDRATAERAVEVLRALDGVTAAYVKAPAEPP
jgi:hypothetical protein